MNYTEITGLALEYADRQDAEVVNNMDNFLKVVESKVNRKLKDMEAETTIAIPCVSGTFLYDLPTDYAGMRDLENENGETFHLRTPEQIDSLSDMSSADRFYSVVGGKLQIYKSFTGDLTMTYFPKVPALTSTETTNWLSDYAPDAYIFGLLVEINAFVKDKETAASWDGRFMTVLNEINIDSAFKRWSGPPMQMRTA